MLFMRMYLIALQRVSLSRRQPVIVYYLYSKLPTKHTMIVPMFVVVVVTCPVLSGNINIEILLLW